MSGEIFDNFEYSPYTSQYVQAPIDELALLGRTLDDKYNTNKAQADADNLIDVPSKNQDVVQRNQILGEYKNQYAKLASDNTENGQVAYEKMGAQQSMITNRLHKDLINGPLAAMQNNLKATQEYYKQIDDNINKGRYDAETGAALKAESEANYKGVGDGGANGIYNSYIGNLGDKQVNPDERVEKLMSGFKDRSNAGEHYGPLPGTKDANGVQEYGWIKGKVSGYDPVGLKTFLSNAVINDPELMASIKQDARLNGRTPDYVSSELNNLLERSSIKYGGQNKEFSYSPDEKWGIDYRAGLEDSKTPPQTPLITGAPGVKLIPQYKDYSDFQNQMQTRMVDLANLNKQIENPDLTPNGKSALLLQRSLLINNIQNANTLKANIENKQGIKDKNAQQIIQKKQQLEKDFDAGKAELIYTPPNLDPNSEQYQQFKEQYVKDKLGSEKSKIADSYNEEFTKENNNNDLSIPKVSLITYSKKDEQKLGKSAGERITDNIKADPTSYIITTADGKIVKPEEIPDDFSVEDMYQNEIPGVGKPLIGYGKATNKKDPSTGKATTLRTTYIIKPSNLSNANALIADDYFSHGNEKAQEIAKNLYNEDISNSISKFKTTGITDLTIPIVGNKKSDGSYDIQKIATHKTSDGGYTWTSPITGNKIVSDNDAQLEKDFIKVKDAINTPGFVYPKK